jgi:hypothetical protein
MSLWSIFSFSIEAEYTRVLSVSTNTDVKEWSQSVAVVYLTKCCCGVPHKVLLWCISQSVAVVYLTKCCCGVPHKVLLWCISQSVAVVYLTKCCCGVPHKVLLWCTSQSVAVVYLTKYIKCLQKWMFFHVSVWGNSFLKFVQEFLVHSVYTCNC